ncbi:MAG: leucine-rich repeat domain-containing protein [Clostridia bacterium]|nr:leucine-rich repeat domain-containing protein [Clostridia bacterium]
MKRLLLKLVTTIIALALALAVAGCGSVAYADESDYRYYELDNGTCSILEYTGNETDVTIPSKINGLTVVSLGEKSFYNNDLIKSVTIPDSVIATGYGAFGFCDSLSSVKIGKGLTTLGECTFYGCDALKSVTFEGAPPTFGWNAFETIAEESGSKPLDVTLYYSAEYANLWAPNGETELDGLTIKPLSQKSSNLILFIAIGAAALVIIIIVICIIVARHSKRGKTVVRDVWVCAVCGADNTGEFCTRCAALRADVKTHVRADEREYVSRDAVMRADEREYVSRDTVMSSERRVGPAPAALKTKVHTEATSTYKSSTYTPPASLRVKLSTSVHVPKIDSEPGKIKIRLGSDEEAVERPTLAPDSPLKELSGDEF